MEMMLRRDPITGFFESVPVPPPALPVEGQKENIVQISPPVLKLKVANKQSRGKT